MSCLFAHVTDSHLHEPDGLRADQLRRAVCQINRLGVAAVVVTGDVAHGPPEVFASAADILGHLNAPVYVVRGNQDTDDTGDAEPFTRHFGPGRMVVRHGDCLLVGFDTSHGPEPDAHEFAWLEHALADTPDDVRHVIAFSHAYLDVPGASDGARLAGFLRDRGVDCYLCGHQHMNREADVAGLRQIVTTCVDPIKSRGVTAGFRVVEVTPDGLRHHIHRLGPDRDRLATDFYPALGMAVREPLVEALRLCRSRQIRWFQYKQWPTELDQQQLQAITLCGRTRVSWHMPGLKIEHPEGPEELSTYCGGLGIAASMGARRITAHVPKVSADLLYDREQARLRPTPEVDRVIDTYVALAEVCRAQHARLCLENNRNDGRELARGIEHLFGSTPEHLIALARAVVDRLPPAGRVKWRKQRVVGFTLDIGHALGNLSEGRVDWPLNRWMQELGRHVWLIHAHDLSVDGPWQSTHLAIGDAAGLASGQLHANWPGIVQAYLHYLPRVPFLVEVPHLSAAVASLDALCPLQLP